MDGQRDFICDESTRLTPRLAMLAIPASRMRAEIDRSLEAVHRLTPSAEEAQEVIDRAKRSARESTIGLRRALDNELTKALTTPQSAAEAS
ncbi:hypothetical protein ATK74_1768 [Propionicimonas paludicola]|uniref:Uncharacterized protein n=1 Tax=Propionicimonas paludicola TaxID=185243 RepID=A0A2A9CT29_9ACTN|nr:hypothetical protein [Propionicimonas paludicola]PFG17205.1 hypothetical protein ATK74_1768 [Propionicimonas paludicola]